ncbi:MAG: glycosyltransferase family 2 protein [Pseudomonadota bacterium]
MSSPSPTTLIVIVNYRSGRLVADCLQSLEPEVRANPGTQVVVVDNCSGDGSADVIAQHIQTQQAAGWAELVRAELNGGFSYGNNVAIRPSFHSAAPADYYWLVNPDTMVRPGALRALLDFMTARPRVGITGSSLEDENGEPWPWAFRFPSVWSEIDGGLRLGVVSKLLSRWTLARKMGAEPEQVDWLPGASMMIRREVFQSVGLMDESYFLYYEETDFCRQARLAGWDCWYVPQSRVMHIAGQSTGVTVKTDRPKRLPAYWFESRRRYFVKNHGRLYAVVADLFWMGAYALWRLRRLIQRKPDTDPPKHLIDFFQHSALWKSRIDVGVVPPPAR